MNIGFDISQTSVNKSGTGFYADQLIRALAKIDKNNQYYLLPWFYDYRTEYKNATKIKQSNFTNVIIKEFSEDNNILSKFDIIQANNFRCPYNTKAKKVVTIHDVSFLEYPEYTTESNRMICFNGTIQSVLYADKIIAVSDYTKERIMHYFPFIKEDKIERIYLGNRTSLLKECMDESTIGRFGLEKGNYFLSVGTIEPRKNYETLLKAYKEYHSNCIGEYAKLCIAGGYGWLEDRFTRYIKSLGLEDDVVVTGYVSDEELANLYNYCTAFVYTTWYEGFGLPVLEAMNFAKPVIVSNVTSVPEVVGDAGILLAPDDEKGFGKAMYDIIFNKGQYEQLSGAAINRAGMFSWEKSATQLLGIYNSLM